MKLALNLAKSDTFAFFDPQSRLHLTVSSPVGVVNGATPAIERGLKSKTLVLLDERNEVPGNDDVPDKAPEDDAINEALLEVSMEPLEASQVPAEPPVPEVPVEEVPPAAPEAPVEETSAEPKKQKKGRGKKTTTE